jgi:hypothetical protein
MGWREKFRADNELLFEIVGGYWMVRAYFFMMMVAFAHQAGGRWERCAGELNCAWSFLRGLVWAAIWPFYWINVATGFVLTHPYG